MAKEPNLQLAGNEDLERARAFWQNNGRPIVAGVLLGILSIGGWNGWQYWQRSEGESASMLYENLLRDDMDHAAATGLVDDLINDYATSPYAVNATLVMAKRSMEASDPAQAQRYLEWAIENASDQILVHIARLRLAQVLLAVGQPEDALSRLQQGRSAASQGPFAARYQELIGDAEAAMGHVDAARQAWESSLALLEVGSVSTSLVQLKLDNLGEL